MSSSISDVPEAAPAASAAAPAAAKRGAFIALEGLDRSGKTTQVKLLQTRFVEAGKEVKAMRFPGRQLSSLSLLEVCTARSQDGMWEGGWYFEGKGSQHVHSPT